MYPSGRRLNRSQTRNSCSCWELELHLSNLYIVITLKYSDSTLHYKALQRANITAYMRCEFLMVVAMKITTFWHVMLCSMVEIHRHLEQPVASVFRLEYV